MATLRLIVFPARSVNVDGLTVIEEFPGALVRTTKVVFLPD